jgi:hypothetical protein
VLDFVKRDFGQCCNNRGELEAIQTSLKLLITLQQLWNAICLRAQGGLFQAKGLNDL